jgi:hypothetical protein
MRILGLYETPQNAFGTNGVLEVTVFEHELAGHDQGTPGV